MAVRRLREWYSIRGWHWYDRRYVYDYFLTAVVLAFQGGITAVIDPFDRYLPPNDSLVAYPAVSSTFPTWSLIPIAILFPVLVFFVISLFHRHKIHDFHHACLGLYECLVFTITVTDGVKYGAGRFRPNWLAMQAEYGNEGRMSFPSGHSSFSFAGMTFLSLYLCGKTRLLSHAGSGSALWLVVCILFPQSIAWMVAVSRTRDYWHDFSDILAGMVVGMFWAFITYFLHYPSLFSKQCDVPKSSAGIGGQEAEQIASSSAGSGDHIV